MPKASVIVPAFNAAGTLPHTLNALLGQTYRDFEIIVVDDGSTDETSAIAETLCRNPKLRIVRQANRGLAGARNTGIAASGSEFVGFCDADDLWMPGKLARHVEHLDSDGDVGLSYSGSMLIDDKGQRLGMTQRPRLRRVKAKHVFKRNPVGNGSAPVMRRHTLEDLAYRPAFETQRDWIFDETFRQSEDIECWLRLALSTDWVIEGIPGALTGYRINGGGLSANTSRQLTAWERMVAKLRPLDPAFFARHEAAARAYQLRYLARRAVSALDGDSAWALLRQTLRTSTRPVFEEPVKTSLTSAAALALYLFGPNVVTGLSSVKRRIANRSYGASSV